MEKTEITPDFDQGHDDAAAAARSLSRQGTAPAIPDREDILAFPGVNAFE